MGQFEYPDDRDEQDEPVLPRIEDDTVEPGTWYRVNESSRTYFFANGGPKVIANVRAIRVSGRDTHYLRDELGSLFIVRNNWLMIYVDEEPTR